MARDRMRAAMEEDDAAPSTDRALRHQKGSALTRRGGRPQIQLNRVSLAM